MVERADPHSTGQDHADPSRYLIFKYDEAPLLGDTDISTHRDGPDDTLERYDRARAEELTDSMTIKLLYRQSGGHSLSLVHAHYKRGRIILRHSHDVDCLYLVTYGSIILGNQTLLAGDGVFVPANHPYTLRAGDDGAELAEFRCGAGGYSTSFRAVADGTWQAMHESATQHASSWRSESGLPSRAPRVPVRSDV